MYTVNAGDHPEDAVIEYILTTPYDISTATVNNTKNVSRGGDTQATQVVFNNDGTKMFIVNHENPKRTVDYYSLSTAFDVSTATFEMANFYCWSRRRANSIAFNNDGTRMVVAGVGNNSQVRIHEYSLSTGFDLSSTVTHLNTEDLSSIHKYIDGVTFNYDGTKMYTITSYGDKVRSS